MSYNAYSPTDYERAAGFGGCYVPDQEPARKSWLFGLVQEQTDPEPNDESDRWITGGALVFGLAGLIGFVGGVVSIVWLVSLLIGGR